MKKKLILISIFALLFLAIFLLNDTVNAAYLEETEVKIYAVDDTLLEKFPKLQVSTNYRQEYQIKVKDTTVPTENMYFYEIDDNGVALGTSYSLEIDKITGTIKPKKKNKVDQYGNLLGHVYSYGTTTIGVRVNDEVLKLKINLIDYSYQYVEEQLKQYIDKNLSKMSEYDKALSIVKYVAKEHGYSTKYQSWRDMYLYECGDCWASTNLINKMCELAGIQSHSRGANRDSGAGSGHENNAILIDGKVYIADAGYVGTKGNRPYDLKIHEPPYTCASNPDGTLTLLQYDGFEKGTLVVPSKIGEKTVTAIGTYFYANNPIQPKNIILPSTIKTINELAFYTSNKTALESINIPKSVISIGYAPFSLCEKAKINVEQSGNFIIENDILYDKNKTVLIQVLSGYSGNSTVTIPNTVKEIKKSSFFGVTPIKYVTLPSGIEQIDAEAFYGAEFESIFIPKSVKKIGYAAFASNENLMTVEIEEGSTVAIGDSAFGRCYYMSAIKIPSTVTTFGTDLFSKSANDLVIYGIEGSKAQSYATENNIKFDSGKINIIKKYISGIEKSYIYEIGKTIKPEPEIVYLGKVLTKGNDYTTTYSVDFDKPGEHQITVKGTGNFAGEVVIDYKIEKAESRFSVSCEDITEGEILNPQINNPDNQTYSVYITNSEGYSVKKVGIPGVYNFRYYVQANDYFKSKAITKQVTIKPASIPLEKIERDGMYYSTMLYEGDVVQLNIIYTPANTTIVKNVQWSTDNKGIIKVDNNGKLTALAEGYEYAYAEVAGRTLLWRIDVCKNEIPLESISIQGINNTIDTGKTVKLSLKMNPTNATCRSEVKWSTSNSDIIDITKNGEITAKKEGQATITVTMLNGKIATQTVTVTNPKVEEPKPEDPVKPVEPSKPTDPTGRLGDTNGDGNITTKDAKMILQHISGKIQLTTEQISRADADKNKTITTKDAKIILQYIAGKIDL